MKLRQWQSECVDIALNHFINDNKHFLCLATPGAGKTVMASEVAAQLFKQNNIDFVLCFSPSITVSDSFTSTFSKRLNHRFDGVIGAIGCSYTYQSMTHFDSNFWQILTNNRVLVIFDEIHHCSGTTVDDANAWGEEIILNIQSKAKYTLSLTGTPWRTDQSPIVLSKYLGDHNAIQCDYVYGLRQAVQDDVCRKPTIVLVDNGEICVTGIEQKPKFFDSFKELLDTRTVSYQDVITNDKAIQYLLGRGCHKLAEIRKINPNAGGLIVASNVEHANQIMQIISSGFKQSAVMVSYRHDEPAETINAYRTNNVQWIVSIGMVAEGTDIPRLQVCCHLSRVKTELYFRQVLGRILRVTNSPNQSAWLYTFSEPRLTEFAYRIEKELPDVKVVIKESISDETREIEDLKNGEPILLDAVDSIDFCFEEHAHHHPLETSIETLINNDREKNRQKSTLDILGKFREKIIETFDSPF